MKTSLKTKIIADCLRFVKTNDKELFINAIERHFKDLKKKKEDITLDDILHLS